MRQGKAQLGAPKEDGAATSSSEEAEVGEPEGQRTPESDGERGAPRHACGCALSRWGLARRQRHGGGVAARTSFSGIRAKPCRLRTVRGPLRSVLGVQAAQAAATARDSAAASRVAGARARQLLGLDSLAAMKREI